MPVYNSAVTSLTKLCCNNGTEAYVHIGLIIPVSSYELRSLAKNKLPYNLNINFRRVPLVLYPLNH